MADVFSLGAEHWHPLLGTVLVTGGCGFIGSFITEAFAAEPSCTREVVASRNPKNFRIPDAEYQSCDMRDAEQIKTLLDEVQPMVIVHTVSPGPPSPSHQNSIESHISGQNDCSSSQNSTQAFEKAKVTDWKSQISAYSRAKGSTETFVLGSGNDASTVDFSESADWRGKILTTTLRVTGLYGPRDKLTIKGMIGLVNTFATRIQIGPNELVHSWCYVDNAANAHVDAAKALLDGRHLRPDMRVDGEEFFVADPEPMKMWDFTRCVQREASDSFCNRPEQERKPIVIPFWVILTVAWISEWLYHIFTFGKRRSNVTLGHFEFMAGGCWFSIEKAKRRLGYKPVCGTEEGIKRSVKWFQDNPDWERAA